MYTFNWDMQRQSILGTNQAHLLQTMETEDFHCQQLNRNILHRSVNHLVHQFAPSLPFLLFAESQCDTYIQKHLSGVANKYKMSGTPDTVP